MEGQCAGVPSLSRSRLSSTSPVAVLALLWLIGGTDHASAVTLEQARENCRETVGRPIVQPCVRAGGDLETCRSKAAPKVRACVERALKAAGGRTTAPTTVPSEVVRPATP